MIPFSPFYPSMYNKRPYYGFPIKNRHNSYTPLPTYSQKDNSDCKKSPTYPTSDSTSEYFDILGIRLYFDDILILCLLFFLYLEKVDDQLLFIALLLLLLS